MIAVAFELFFDYLLFFLYLFLLSLFIIIAITSQLMHIADPIQRKHFWRAF